MTGVDFHIPWLPRPKQSFRYTQTGRKYTPADVKEDQRSLASLIEQHRPDKPLVGPLRFAMTIIYPWRKSESKRVRALGLRPKGTKPDTDNLQKQVCDVLERMGFFENDAQIAQSNVAKFWGDAVGTRIAVNEIDWMEATDDR